MHVKVKLLNQVNPARQPQLTTTAHAAMGAQAQLWPSSVDGIKLMLPKCRRVIAQNPSSSNTANESTHSVASSSAQALIATSLTGARAGTKYAECTQLELEKTLEEQQVQNDDILFCLFAKDQAGTKWDDAVDVPAFEPLGQEELQQQLQRD